ncbi:MAG TPA: hypothetical protein VM487_21090 [Phycisphaerae bacterium]|nr:hypothetical protein [Phycisphaerae bacterium]
MTKNSSTEPHQAPPDVIPSPEERKALTAALAERMAAKNDSHEEQRKLIFGKLSRGEAPKRPKKPKR